MISADSGDTYTTYTYDYRNRLTEVKQGGTLIATYTYNALDQRIGIQDSGGSTTWTIYNGASADALPYADFNGSGGALLTRYVSGPGMVNGAVVDELLARTSSGGTTAWYLTDKLDSVRDVVSSAGSVLDHVVYDSFGNITTETNASNGDRFKFAGMEYDATTGQYFDRARYYSNAVGRFTGLDPMGFSAGDTDLYAYVGGSPTNDVDPSGRLGLTIQANLDSGDPQSSGASGAQAAAGPPGQEPVTTSDAIDSVRRNFGHTVTAGTNEDDGLPLPSNYVPNRIIFRRLYNTGPQPSKLVPKDKPLPSNGHEDRPNGNLEMTELVNFVTNTLKETVDNYFNGWPKDIPDPRGTALELGGMEGKIEIGKRTTVTVGGSIFFNDRGHVVGTSPFLSLEIRLPSKPDPKIKPNPDPR